MQEDNKVKKLRSRYFLFIAAISIVLIAAVLFLLWLLRSADRELKNDLLRETRIVAQSVNLARISSLTGTENDLHSPDYLRLKEQFSRMRAANKKCRFIYLMGRNPEGSIFFFVDSEPAGSEDESPPGQIYTEASASLLRVFQEQQETVEGPYTDRWGTWVSAFVPLIDSETGVLSAVLGMDVDARRWDQLIIRQAALPVGLMLIILLMSVFSVFVMRSRERLHLSDKRYRQLFEENNDAIFIADLVTRRLTDCNKKAQTLTGRTKREILSMFADQLHPEDVAEETMEGFKKQASGAIRTIDSQVLTKDGRRLDVSINATIVEIEGKPHLMGVFRDVTERRLAEELLKEREKLLNEVEGLAKIGGWEIDLATGNATWTKGAYDIVEIAYDKPIPGLNEHLEYYLPEYRSMIKEKIDNLIKTKQPMMFEALAKTAKSNLIWLQVIGETVVKDGQVVKIRGTLQDITERKAAENALKASEEKFRGLFEHSPDGVMLIHPHQGIFDCNAAALKVFGLSRKDELVNKHLGIDFSPDAQPGNVPSQVLRKRYIEQVYQIGFSSFEWVYKRKDESTFTAEVILSTITYSGEPILQAVLRDISDRKQMEEALRNSEAQLSNAAKIAHLGPWVYDVINDVFTFNDAFYAIFRTTAEQVGGYTMSGAEYARRFLYPEDAHLVVEETQKAIEASDPHFSRQLEHRIIYADGATGYITVRFFIVKDEKGRTIRTYGVNQDITERKKAEEEIKLAYQDLKNAQAQLIQSNKMSALGQLAAGVAHELNNPLTGVLNNVQLIKMEAQDRKDFNMNDFQELIEAVEESALRCKKIAQSLLEFTHAAKGEFGTHSLNELIEKTVFLVAQELKLHNIRFRKDLQPDLPQIKCDPQLLQQVIYGLITNSHWAILKKAEKEGTIILKTWHVEKEKTVNMSVSDTGIGIPAENIAKLFTPFFTTKDVGEGTGLGLALFYNIIKSHNGDIKVESLLNEGTTFTIILPAAGSS